VSGKTNYCSSLYCNFKRNNPPCQTHNAYSDVTGSNVVSYFRVKEKLKACNGEMLQVVLRGFWCSFFPMGENDELFGKHTCGGNLTPAVGLKRQKS